MNNALGTLLCPSVRHPKLLRFFEEISAIPRETYHEEAIADYLCEFAREQGLEYHRDAYQNVLITKPASAGFAHTSPILLQGHTDMVCEKNAGVAHDFARDPLDLYVEDGWLRARGTTLGADDGVAVAAMLYLLDGGIENHPPLECLFTASEEMGMDGAENFDYSLIRARRMLNMDSPDEQLIIAGCAGGVHSYLTLSATPIPTVGSLYRLHIGGLFGGHSGEDIHRGRKSAISLMTAVLRKLSDATELHLISLDGGRRENVIPRECEAIVSVADERILSQLSREFDSLTSNLCEEDRECFLSADPLSAASYPTMMTSADTERLLGLMHTIPCGVLEKNALGTVEYSRNLGVVATDRKENVHTVHLTLLSRSPRDAQLAENKEALQQIAASFGEQFRHAGDYPGWDYAPQSPLRDAYIEAHQYVYGQRPTVTTIHAGLECGIIAKKIPDMDMISVGPRVLDLHSPDERLSLESFDAFMDILRSLLGNL